MISGNRNELFEAEKIEESYNLIENKNKKLINLEGKLIHLLYGVLVLILIAG